MTDHTMAEGDGGRATLESPPSENTPQAGQPTPGAGQATTATENGARRNPVDAVRRGGEVVADGLRTVVHESTARHLVIRGADDRVLLDAPLVVGVVSMGVAPVWAAVGACVALATNCSIRLEHRG
jgi:hypothetical protein